MSSLDLVVNAKLYHPETRRRRLGAILRRCTTPRSSQLLWKHYQNDEIAPTEALSVSLNVSPLTIGDLGRKAEMNSVSMFS